MAITFRSVTSKSTNAETISPHDIVITKPAGTVNKDILVAFIQTQGNINNFDVVPAGWSTLATVRTPTTSNAGVYMGAWWKRADGSEGANFTWSMAASAVYSGAIVCYQGGSTVTGVAASGSTTSDSATDTSVTAPSLSPTRTNSMLVTGHGCNPSAVPGVPITWTPPAGMTERFDSNITDDGTTLRASLEVCELAVATTAATGAKDATVSNDGRNIGISVVLNSTFAPPGASVAGPHVYRPRNTARQSPKVGSVI